MDDGSLLLTVMRRPGGLLVRSDPHRLPHARNIGCACKRQSILLFYFHLFFFFLMQSSNLSTTTTTRHDHLCFLSVWSGLCIWIILQSICAKCEDQLGLISKPCGSAHISLGLHSSQRLRGVACIIGKYNQMCTPVVTDTFPHMHTPESSPGCPQPKTCSDCVRIGARSTVAC